MLKANLHQLVFPPTDLFLHPPPPPPPYGHGLVCRWLAYILLEIMGANYSRVITCKDFSKIAISVDII